MNKAILIGRLTHDPEVRHEPDEDSLAVVRYTLAVDCRGSRRSLLKAKERGEEHG